MLNRQQLTVLETVVNVIIPADADPGGWEGGVGDYLLHQFEGDLKHVLATYQQGLLALDTEAKTVTGKELAELDPQAQEAFMANIERGEVQTLWPVDPAVFFAMLVEHCAEGFYSDPGNHGNRDHTAWKMIGFEVRG
jgi:Gluconate 2-dehydrogenase subunit 3